MPLVCVPYTRYDIICTGTDFTQFMLMQASYILIQLNVSMQSYY